MLFSGQDLGKGPKGFYRSSEYENGLTIKAENKDAMLTALKENFDPGDWSGGMIEGGVELQDIDLAIISMLQKFFTNNTKLITDLQALLGKAGVACEFYSWY